MRCYGSSLFLKNKFGVGYHLTLVHRKATKFSVLFLIWKFHACSLVLRSEGADVSALRRLVRTHVTGARQARYPLYKQANAMFAELILYFLPVPPNEGCSGGSSPSSSPGTRSTGGLLGFFPWSVSGDPELLFARNAGMYDGICSVEKILLIF